MKELDNTSFGACVESAMRYLRALKKEYEDYGYVFNYGLGSTWALEQAIINRKPSESMAEGAMRYIDKVDYDVKLFNGI